MWDESEAGPQTCDYEAPVGDAPEAAGFDLPPIEDTGSIQLALIDVLQALAANQLDTKRPGLLLYGPAGRLGECQHFNLPISGVRSISYTDEGTPLARRSTVGTSKT